MEHLVESHLGGYYISDGDPEFIEAYCDQCGDSDNIILSWEEGQRLESLSEYFSRVKETNEQIEIQKELGVSTDDLIFSLTCYYDNNRCIINDLVGSGEITHEERLALLKLVSISQKKQFEILKSVYYSNGFIRIKKKNN